MVQENDGIVLSCLVRWERKGSGLQRAQIMTLTNLPRTTTYDALTRLELAGYVKKELIPRTTRGRCKVAWRLNDELPVL